MQVRNQHAEVEWHDDARQALTTLRKFDAALYACWGEALEKAIEIDELDARTRAVVRVALDSVIHWSRETIVVHVDDAFNAGSNVAEILEVVFHVAGLESGGHGIHDGLEALDLAIQAREKAGLSTPLVGAPLGPDDLPPQRVDKVPLTHDVVLEKYAPELYAAHQTFKDQSRIKTRKGLNRHVEELAVTAVDVVIFWPEPLVDLHVNEAFKVGVTVQEMLEAIVFSTTVSQGARATNLAAAVREGAFLSIHHGVSALERVLQERERAGLVTRKDKTSPSIAT